MKVLINKECSDYTDITTALTCYKLLLQAQKSVSDGVDNGMACLLSEFSHLLYQYHITENDLSTPSNEINIDSNQVKQDIQDISSDTSQMKRQYRSIGKQTSFMGSTVKRRRVLNE